jgi:hypothetical protein
MYYNQNQGLINQLERQKDNIDNLYSIIYLKYFL